jgi:hypothetical protein
VFTQSKSTFEAEVLKGRKKIMKFLVAKVRKQILLSESERKTQIFFIYLSQISVLVTNHQLQ